MREAFEDRNLSPERLALLAYCNEIIEDYQADGLDLSVRQLYYQLVSKNLIENSKQSYNRIKDLLNIGRMIGEVDWSAIVDRSRETAINNHWETPEDYLEDAAEWFEVDKWAKQPVYVEVMCEKQALEGIFEPLCLQLDVPFTSNKGYCSQSAMYRRGKVLRDKIAKQGKPVRVIYFGDHDPSGLDMDRDLITRFLTFSGVGEALSHKPEKMHKVLQVKRVALTRDQIDHYRPPENPAKLTDSRSSWYVKEHGSSSWELDALDPKVLRSLLKAEILQYRDEDLWQEAVKEEEEGKERLREMARRFETEED